MVQWDSLEVKIRNKISAGIVVPYHMRAEAPPSARAIMWNELGVEVRPAEIREKANLAFESELAPGEALLATLVQKTVDNTRWRQTQCINLIPSEQTASTFSRMLSIMDPAGRYAEHKK